MSRGSVLITGCAPGGIGHSLAKEFHRQGFRVFATARNKDVLVDLFELGLETLSLDVTSPENVRDVKEDIQARTEGRLDYLVNNAGRNYTVPALDVDFDEVRLTFETNLFGVMRMCQEFSSLLIRAKGTIVQIGSVAGIIPYVFGSSYNASKAALHSYSDTLRIELAPFEVKVVIVITGGVQSRIARVDRQLPQDSIYLPINEAYLRRTKHSQDQAMSHTDYARSVVLSLLRHHASRSHPREIWQGAKIWMVWIIHTFLPKSAFDHLFTRMFQLDQLANTVQSASSTTTTAASTSMSTSTTEHNHKTD